MNFKKQADRLEKFLEDEFSSKIPIIVLPNKDLVYKRFKIKKTKQNMWDLNHITGDVIDSFRLKATAVMAAKFYDNCRFDLYNRVKNLDTGYWTNTVDSLNFKSRCIDSNDIDRKALYTARWELTYHRAKFYQGEISTMFRHSFDK